MKDVNILTNNGVNVAQSLELFGDMEMYDETLQDFLNMIDAKLASLEKYKTTSDMANYAIEVHSLKSDARYLGFTSLADMSYDSELKSKAGDVMFVQENHPKILEETKRMINVAKQYLGMIPVQPATQPAAPVEAASAPTPAPEATPAATPEVATTTPTPAETPTAAPTEEKLTIEFFPAEPTVQFFPVNTPDTAMQPTAASAFTDPMSAGGKQGTLLIVDDSSLVSNFVKKIFETNYDVVSCVDGSEAIAYVDNEENRKNIKAVLLDLNMPNVDGFAVLEHFKQNGYFVKIPVAVESGVEDMDSIDRANQYPIVDVLSKPFNERDIQRVMEKCLATYF